MWSMDDERKIREMLPGSAFDQFRAALDDVLTYSPVIAFMGKSGVGKSSTGNAIFGRDLYKVGHVVPTTRDTQAEVKRLARGSITLIDVPGVGEDVRKKDEYEKLYLSLLDKGYQHENGGRFHPLDAVVWVLRADDRAFEVDTAFLRAAVWPACTDAMKRRFVVALNQADKIEPLRGTGGWNEQAAEPGTEQVKNLELKRRDVARQFELPLAQVVTYSANERWNLSGLFEAIVHALPSERRPLTIKLAKEVDDRPESAQRPFGEGPASSSADRQPRTRRRTVSSKVEEVGKRSFWEKAWDVAKKVLSTVAGPIFWTWLKGKGGK